MSKRFGRPITRNASVRKNILLNPEEDALLAQIAHDAGVSEGQVIGALLGSTSTDVLGGVELVRKYIGQSST